MALIIFITLGLMSGVLINYLADILPVQRWITFPLCSTCNQRYTIKDYLLFRKCSNCGKRASTRSIIVLISATVACILLKYYPFSILSFWATLPLLIFLGVIMVIDIEHHAVLLKTNIFGFILCTIYGIILRGFSRTIAGALGGLLIMLSFYFLGIAFSKVIGILRHQKIHEVAFGFGDVCIGTVLGLLTGWPSIVGAVVITILAFGGFSLVVLLSLLLSKRYNAFSSALPFAPFLILGVLVIFYL